ncbi:MAG: Nif3-like dinuclear metal center hexameric protein [Phycisphaerales bacterium]
MLVRDLVLALDSIAPPFLAEPWDNTGLLVGSATAALAGPVMLTIDLGDAQLDEAAAARCSAIISYHPPIFEPLRRINDTTRAGRVVLRAAAQGCAILSPHTALDAARDGLTDWLAGAIASGSTERPRRALVPAAPAPAGEHLKIITFAPAETVAALRAALAEAGAGCIGAYSHCSFSSAGTGTFLGSAGTSPAVGQAGRLESVAEARLEMICPRAALPGALAALRRTHPYEEPAVDVFALHPRPDESIGAGRVVTLDAPVSVAELARRLAALLGPSAHIQTTRDTQRPVRIIGLCPGAGGSLLAAARDARCDAFITGELKHHESLSAIDSGLALILAGHTQTERGYLPILARRLAVALPGLSCLVSRTDAPPLTP